MKSLLAKYALHKAVGVCLNEHEVTVSKVAFTPLGPVEVASTSEPFTPDTLADVLKKLLEPLLGRKHRVPVAVGLPSSRLFFGTRPIAGSELTAEAMLHKSLCSPTISIDDLTADMLVGTVRKLPVASIAACRKKYMVGVVAALNRLGVRLVRAEPSPCALVRTAVAQRKFPRRGKTTLCVFLGTAQGLAAVVVDGRPLAWKTFALPAGAESAAILSAARTLQTQGKNYGVESALDYAIIHGRADLHERLQQEQLPSKLSIRVVWQDGPALDGAAMAYGLATGCLNQNAKAFDLSRQMKARASIWEIFPWWDLTYASLLVAWLGVTLFAHSSKLEEDYMVVRTQSSSHKCLVSGESKNLKKKTENLVKKVEAVYKYLNTRILWTEYTRDISIRLPAEAMLSTFTGEWILESGRKTRRAAKKSLLFRAIVPQMADGSAPREIDEFLEELRHDPLLQRDFGSVRLTDIKRSLSRDRKSTVAAFTVVCLPKAKGSAKRSTSGAAGKKRGRGKK